MAAVSDALQAFVQTYKQTTPKRVKAIDAFLLFILLTALVQFVYCVLVGTFPFNAFLAGFLSCVGMFILTVSLRAQVTKPQDFHGISAERAFIDYIFCNMVLHLVVINFIG
eukprot:TRINITY_DN11479_c0_g1::TRINITY_DN11479_c0_g1_i1::g.10910::m.10910 TRINITY_DN11479_c0_g1::TRINITY_DN11479_c0_g1_i1::g.10910  ORF type:complete len:124 (+),score=16.09,sp/Q5RBB4/DAD1_PONAB/57.14/1e-39,DAD/PF02109.11/4.1e-45,PIG-F/PF06699.6/0.042,DUF4191/PF13829.1/0.053 TRINITY_DN11479_c0_g1_i1:40-372(+)